MLSKVPEWKARVDILCKVGCLISWVLDPDQLCVKNVGWPYVYSMEDVIKFE